MDMARSLSSAASGLIIQRKNSVCLSASLPVSPSVCLPVSVCLSVCLWGIKGVGLKCCHLVALSLNPLATVHLESDNPISGRYKSSNLASHRWDSQPLSLFQASHTCDSRRKWVNL